MSHISTSCLKIQTNSIDSYAQLFGKHEMTNRNPLAVLLGGYLKDERNTYGLSSKQMAEELKFSPSVYRMIEAGSGLFYANRYHKLIRIFNKSDILPERMVLFLSTLNAFQFEEHPKVEWRKLRLEFLSFDKNLTKLLRDVAPLFELDYKSKEHTSFLKDKAIWYLRDFLNNEEYTPRDSTQFQAKVIQSFESTPSMYMASHLEFINAFGGHPPLHVGTDAKDWEKRNAKKFVSLRALQTNKSQIISEQNFDQFTYQYLFYPNFEEVRFIFKDTVSADEVREDFIRLLNLCRKSQALPILGKIEQEKVHIKVIHPSEEANKHLEPLLQGRSDLFNTLDSYWSFRHMNGVDMGFVGGRQEEEARKFTINLQYGESERRIELFDKIWDNLK